MGILSHEQKIWARLHGKGDDKLAQLHYTTMIEPIAIVLCYATGA
jgi:hypothetical protein